MRWSSLLIVAASAFGCSNGGGANKRDHDAAPAPVVLPVTDATPPLRDLVLDLFRLPGAQAEIRAALVTYGADAAAAMRRVLQHGDPEVESFFDAKRRDRACERDPNTSCEPMIPQEHYAALVLGDLRDAGAIPDLVHALVDPALPKEYEYEIDPPQVVIVRAIVAAMNDSKHLLTAVKAWAAVAWADGKVVEAERMTMNAIISVAKLTDDEKKIATSWLDEPVKLEDLALDRIPNDEKIHIYQVACGVAGMDEDIAQAERVFLDKLAAALQLSPEDAKKAKSGAGL